MIDLSMIASCKGYDKPAHTDRHRFHVTTASMRRSRGWVRGSGPPLKNHKTVWFLSNTGLDLPKNHKTTKPAFNVGTSSSARQQNAI